MKCETDAGRTEAFFRILTKTENKSRYLVGDYVGEKNYHKAVTDSLLPNHSYFSTNS